MQMLSRFKRQEIQSSIPSSDPPSVSPTPSSLGQISAVAGSGVWLT